MAITQEQYNKFRVGDTLTVAHKVTGQWEILTDQIRVDSDNLLRGLFLGGYSLRPDAIYRDYILLEHKPRPLEFWSARVIEYLGEIWIPYNHFGGSRMYENGAPKDWKHELWINSSGSVRPSIFFEPFRVKILVK